MRLLLLEGEGKVACTVMLKQAVDIGGELITRAGPLIFMLLMSWCVVVGGGWCTRAQTNTSGDKRNVTL